VQLTVIETDEDHYKEHLEKLAKDFLCPAHTLFAGGLVKVFPGTELPVRLKEAEIRVEL
jgi:hypothetical protein